MQTEIIYFVYVAIVVLFTSLLSACITVFVHTIIGSPTIHTIHNADGYNIEIETNDSMIFSFIGNFVANMYAKFDKANLFDLPNPFKIFICQFCLNVWVSGILAVTIIANSNYLNWYYFFAIVVISSFIRDKYVA